MFDRVFARLQAVVQDTRTRTLNMVARAVVKTIDDEKKMQLLQISLLTDETRDDVERFQNYGFTSNPKDGAEAVVAFVGGSRDHGLVIAVDDRRYRLHLESGEVAMYNDQGAKIVMKKNHDIEVTSTTKVKIDAPDVEMTGDLKVDGTLTVDGAGSIGDGLTVTGDVGSSGTVTASTDVVGGGKHLKTHVHSYSDADTASGGAGGTKDTAAPT